MRSREIGRPPLPHSLGWGIGLAATTAVISGIAVYVNAAGVKQIPDAAVYTTLKNGVAALLLVGILLVTPHARAAVPHLSGRQWLSLVAIGVIGGSVPFLLFFTGLSMASAPGAAFIHKTLFIWVALLAVPLLAERLGWLQIVALVVLLGSQVMMKPPTGVVWGGGETLMFAATLLWAVEVIVARRLLRSIPSTVGAVGRMGIGLVVLVGYLAVTGRIGMIAELSAVQWFWVLGTGLLLAGYVATWYAALRRAPATTVTAVLVAAAPITAGLSALESGTLPEMIPMGGYLLTLGAVALLAWMAFRRQGTSAVAA